MDRLIEGHIKEFQAVVPQPNPRVAHLISSSVPAILRVFRATAVDSAAVQPRLSTGLSCIDVTRD